jgi:hypothetical protein
MRQLRSALVVLDRWVALAMSTHLAAAPAGSLVRESDVAGITGDVVDGVACTFSDTTEVPDPGGTDRLRKWLLATIVRFIDDIDRMTPSIVFRRPRTGSSCGPITVGGVA